MTQTENGEKLQAGLLRGIEKLNNAVSDTLGPYGRTVLLKDQYGKIKTTKDGVSVAKGFIELEDQIEDMGAQLVKKVSEDTNNKAGDGTTTSTLLATSIIKEGFKVMEKGSNSVSVKKGIDLAVKQVIEKLKENKADITENSQIQEVATISGNNDPEIGTLISTAIDKVGREGIISVEKSKFGETSLDVVEGMQFDRGYKSPYFVTDNNTMQATLEKPLILIYSGRITSAQDLVGVMNKANIEQRSLLVIAEDIDGEALSTLIVNKVRGVVDSVAVKAPDFGDRRLSMLEDLAIITGGQVISTEKGMKLDKINPNEWNKYLGNARTVTITKENTTIVDGECEPAEIEKRTEEIKTQIDKASSPFEKEKLQERLGRMVGGVAVVSIGGNSEVEIEEKKDRVDDALHATRAAIEEGVLPGGGSALLYAREGIIFNEIDKDIKLGQQIVYDACSAPFTRILENAGYDSEDIKKLISDLTKKPDIWNGYDLVSESIVNMRTKGILDPVKVTRYALLNASSVAGTILTTNNLVIEKREEQKEQPSLY